MSSAEVHCTTQNNARWGSLIYKVDSTLLGSLLVKVYTEIQFQKSEASTCI